MQCTSSELLKTRSLAIADEPGKSPTNRAMPVCKVVEVLQDFLSEYVEKKFTRDYNVILYLYLSSIVSELYDA